MKKVELLDFELTETLQYCDVYHWARTYSYKIKINAIVDDKKVSEVFLIGRNYGSAVIRVADENKSQDLTETQELLKKKFRFNKFFKTCY